MLRRKRRKERGRMERKWLPTGMGMRLPHHPIPIPPKRKGVKRERRKSQLHLGQAVRPSKRQVKGKMNKQLVCMS